MDKELIPLATTNVKGDTNWQDGFNHGTHLQRTLMVNLGYHKLPTIIEGEVTLVSFPDNEENYFEEILRKEGYVKLNEEKEWKLEKLLKKDGERTPSSDLFCELADPEFRYLYAKAIKSTDGQLVALARKTLIKEGYAKLDEEKVAQEIHRIVLSFVEQHGGTSPKPMWENLRETARETYRREARQIMKGE